MGLDADGVARSEAGQPAGQPRWRGRAIRSGLFVALGYGGAQVVRFAGNLMLTRLLFEEAFGLMALIAAVLQGLELFSDLGIGPSIIQNEREDRSFVDTAFTMQALRGLVLWLAACALASPLASLYEEPALAWLIPLCAVNALLGGLHSTKLFTLNRELSLGRVEIVQLVAQVAGVLAMVVWALLSPSVLALVAGTLVTGVVRTLMTHLFLPGTMNRFAWERRAMRELVRFGRWIFLSTVLTFLAGQSDRLVFGKMVPMDRLGVYSIGMALAMLPSEVLAKLSMLVVFPLQSRLRDQPASFAAAFEKARLPIVAAAGWATSGLIAGGPAAVDVLYDARYQDAGWIIQLLAFASWFLVLGGIYGAVLLAQGAPERITAASLAKLVAMAVLIPGGHFAGRALHEDAAFAGAVAGFSLAELFRYLVTVGAARRYVPGLAHDLRMTLMVLGVGLGGALGARALEPMGVGAVARGALVALGVTLLWLPVGWSRFASLVRDRG